MSDLFTDAVDDITAEEPARQPMSARAQFEVVKRYLESLSVRSRRGRQIDEDTLQARLTQIEEDLEDAHGVERLLLTQKRLDLQERLSDLHVRDTHDEAEKAFVTCAADWAARRSVSYEALREVGVKPEVLRAAGIEPGSRHR